ncbi:MAG: hypothetical protein DWH94_06695, partial [Planctomycetota bacterium]
MVERCVPHLLPLKKPSAGDATVLHGFFGKIGRIGKDGKSWQRFPIEVVARICKRALWEPSLDVTKVFAGQPTKSFQERLSDCGIRNSSGIRPSASSLSHWAISGHSGAQVPKS